MSLWLLLRFQMFIVQVPIGRALTSTEITGMTKMGCLHAQEISISRMKFNQNGRSNPGGRACSIPLRFYCMILCMSIEATPRSPHFVDRLTPLRIFLGCLHQCRIRFFIAPSLWRTDGGGSRESPVLSEGENYQGVFELLLIWTGCSPNGEFPLYLCNGLNYFSCDRLSDGSRLITRVMHQMVGSRRVWVVPMHHCDKLVCVGVQVGDVGKNALSVGRSYVWLEWLME